MNDIILVNKNDEAIGKMEKLLVHQKGLLHRAFSILLFDNKKQMLIQKRKEDKYHSSGLWSNACCSHPKPNEKIQAAAHRRLIEELNLDCHLDNLFSFIYKTNFNNNLIEYEFDHVFVGKINETPKFNPKEISEVKWIPMNSLLIDLNKNPNNYSYWFKIIINDYFQNIEKHLNESL